MRLITVSATYGTGGSVVAPALAQRLGLPFLQRVTTTEGEVALDVAPCHERLVAEEAKTTPVHRLLASFTHSMPVGPTQSPLAARHQDDDLRCSAEAGIHGLVADGGGVILGPAAAGGPGTGRGVPVPPAGPPARPIIRGAPDAGISQEQARGRARTALRQAPELRRLRPAARQLPRRWRPGGGRRSRNAGRRRGRPRSAGSLHRGVGPAPASPSGTAPGGRWAGSGGRSRGAARPCRRWCPAESSDAPAAAHHASPRGRHPHPAARAGCRRGTERAAGAPAWPGTADAWPEESHTRRPPAGVR